MKTPTPLTNEEIREVFMSNTKHRIDTMSFARAIEAAVHAKWEAMLKGEPVDVEPLVDVAYMVWQDKTTFDLGKIRAEFRAVIAAPQPAQQDSDKVICPSCCHQFRAIPENVQQLMLGAGFEPPFTHPPTSAAKD